MARQREDSTAGFGSDSFLDIIANIVGILIILIVIAGVKVSRAPIEAVSSQTETATPTVRVSAAREPGQDVTVEPRDMPSEPTGQGPLLSDDDAAPLERPISYLPETPEESLTALSIPAPPPLAPPDPIAIEPADDLSARLSRVRDEIRQIEQKLEAVEGHVQSESQQVRALRQQRADLENEHASLRDAVRTSSSDLNELQQALRVAQGRYTRVQQALAEADQQKAPSETIEHRLTPVGRIVHDHEIHFRLAYNRISYVPVDELLERLKSQVERQKNWLTRFHRHQGVVGPVEGYTMNYVVQRQSLSAIDQLRHGTGTIRISVSEWELVTDSGLVTESLQEALHPSSRFIARLQETPPGTVLTFWVYPDSYALFRDLQRFAHQEGFTVAGRPLPEGVPIAGGPNGSRSVAQ